MHEILSKMTMVRICLTVEATRGRTRDPFSPQVIVIPQFIASFCFRRAWFEVSANTFATFASFAFILPSSHFYKTNFKISSLVVIFCGFGVQLMKTFYAELLF